MEAKNPKNKKKNFSSKGTPLWLIFLDSKSETTNAIDLRTVPSDAP